jgi:hypothetical protein
MVAGFRPALNNFPKSAKKKREMKKRGEAGRDRTTVHLRQPTAPFPV